MARTPLLRALQRLALAHRRAERLGISTAELREREQERAYSRGEFLRRSGTAGAAVALAGPAVFARTAHAAPGKRIATVQATTALTALRVPAEAFQDFVIDHPRVGLSIMKQLVIRLREVEQRIDAWMA